MKKVFFLKMYIMRINAASREHRINYSRFITGEPCTIFEVVKKFVLFFCFVFCLPEIDKVTEKTSTEGKNFTSPFDA